MLWNGRYRIETARKIDWDYSTASWYFITVCANPRAPVFGRVVGNGESDSIERSPLGDCVRRQWLEIPAFYTDVVLDEWQVMPDHFHALLWLDGTPLGRIVNRFKGRVTAENNEHAYSDFQWQTRFHDEIVKSQKQLDHVRRYIQTNPHRV